MKNLFVFLGSIAFIAIAGASGCGSCCKANPPAAKMKSVSFNKTSQPKTITLKITGMDCAGCAKYLHMALSKTNGVMGDEVKYPGDIAVVKYDPSRITEKDIISVIEKAGYKAVAIKDKTVNTL